MGSDSMSAGQPGSWSKFPQCNGKRGREYETWVSDLVSKYNHISLPLVSPAGATLTIGGVEDTIYRDKPREVNGWGKFYLEDEVNMQVIGVVEGTSCPCDLVLMTCEDKKVYAYDGEELHEVAPGGVKQLCDEGIEYPASKAYYKGEAFKNMTKEDWDEVKKGPVGRRLDEEQRKLVTANKSRFIQSLKNSRMKRSVKHIQVS